MDTTSQEQLVKVKEKREFSKIDYYKDCGISLTFMNKLSQVYLNLKCSNYSDSVIHGITGNECWLGDTSRERNN